jgi:hypothetical protein
MPAEIFYPDYNDEGVGNLYPFADDAVLRTTDGLDFDPDMLLDASIYPAGLDKDAALTAVIVDVDSIRLVIGDRTASSRCEGSFTRLDTKAPSGFTLFDNLGRNAGVLVANPDLALALHSWPVGTHPFAPGTAKFAVSTTVPSPQLEVTGIATTDGEIASGAVWLVGEQGVVVTKEDDELIRIDVVGDPLFAQRLCEPNGLFTPPTPIRAIRFIDDYGHKVKTTPDAYGNITIAVSDLSVGDTILRISPTGPATLDIGTAVKAAGT